MALQRCWQGSTQLCTKWLARHAGGGVFGHDTGTNIDSPFIAGEKAVSLPELPYGYSALEPHINAEIMELHHSKHHQTYVNSYNKLLEEAQGAEGKGDSQAMPKLSKGLNFHGGGHLNHSIFWKNLCPAKDAAPLEGQLLEAVNKDFGDLDKLKETMNSNLAGIQGSGWGWLAAKPSSGRLQLLTTANQDAVQVVQADLVPILGIDAWEHAYYLQYKNVKADYFKAIWNVINWEDVSRRYQQAMKGDAGFEASIPG